MNRLEDLVAEIMGCTDLALRWSVYRILVAESLHGRSGVHEGYARHAAKDCGAEQDRFFRAGADNWLAAGIGEDLSDQIVLARPAADHGLVDSRAGLCLRVDTRPEA